MNDGLFDEIRGLQGPTTGWATSTAGQRTMLRAIDRAQSSASSSTENPSALRSRWDSRRRRVLVLGLCGVFSLTAGVAVAAGGPTEVVKGAIAAFTHRPGAQGHGGVLDDPVLVAEFRTPRGIYAFWTATSSTGAICSATSDGTWDGEGAPTAAELDGAGCGGEVISHADPSKHAPLTRLDQLGGFFRDDAGPLIYGVAPYPEAVSVHVQGEGVDRTLPVRADSHGFGAAIPEAVNTDVVRLTFLDDAGVELGSERWVAPVG
jgi:hypothetical protein